VVAWSKEFPYPLGPDGRPVAVFDYYAMLLHLPETDLEAVGDEVTIHVATANGVEPYRVVVDTCRTTERKITDLAGGRPCSIAVPECRLRIVPGDATDEGFLGMEGETEVWVEKGSKTPIEISGKVPGVPGRVTVTLNGIASSAPPPG
jgi:hypothetical protein